MKPEQQPQNQSPDGLSDELAQHDDTHESLNAPADSSGTNEKLPNEGLINQVLAATLSGDGSVLTDHEWEAIEQVARAHAPGTVVDLGIASQVVTAFLASRFPTLASQRDLLNRMSFRIAGSLWSHPVAKQRLIRFWELISGHVRL